MTQWKRDGYITKQEIKVMSTKIVQSHTAIMHRMPSLIAVYKDAMHGNLYISSHGSTVHTFPCQGPYPLLPLTLQCRYLQKNVSHTYPVNLLFDRIYSMHRVPGINRVYGALFTTATRELEIINSRNSTAILAYIMLIYLIRKKRTETSTKKHFQKM